MKERRGLVDGRKERKITDLVFGEGEGGADEGRERVGCEPSQSSLAGRTHLAGSGKRNQRRIVLHIQPRPQASH